MNLIWKLKVKIYLFLLLCAFPALTVDTATADASRPPDIDELQYKAAILEKFTRFVTWPKNSDVADTSKPFILGVVEDESLWKSLNESFAHQPIKNKKVVVRLILKQSEIGECNLLLIPTTLTWDMSIITRAVNKKPIFTISERYDYSLNGIHIGMMTIREKVRYRLNVRALKESNFSWTFHLSQQAEELVGQDRRRR